MYAKVFSQILDSSLAEDYQIRHVFEDLLKLCDWDGVVDMTHEAIARRTNVPIEIIRKAILDLENPDPKSRNPAHEGRRIARLDEHRDWGWVVINFSHYRTLASEEQRREKTAVRVKKFREKANKSEDVTQCNAVKRIVNDSTSVSISESISSSLEGSGEPLAPKNKRFTEPEFAELELYATKIGLPATEINKFEDFYKSNGWRVGKNPMKDWRSAMRNWKRNYDDRKYQGRPGTGESNPRNAHVATAGPSFEELARRKQQRQAELQRQNDARRSGIQTNVDQPKAQPRPPSP